MHFKIYWFQQIFFAISLLFLVESISTGIVHTDYLFMYEKQSELPVANGGMGVFAKVDIPPNEFLCEYIGIAYTDTGLAPAPSRKKYSTTVAKRNFTINGDTLCAVINDCISLEKFYSDSNYFESSEIATPTLPGFSYNAEARRTKMGKVLLYSKTTIKAHTEICFSYGKVCTLTFLELFILPFDY